ncbi:LysR family transcriptional regulator [Calidifontibacter sp. DB0510]|uniref:LysR family transcriptional regulator n=1 Tax=Metallococcus carri TaxID=1656884 RepID=A0A967B2T5_9MICO|nr:LysR family transcriptional regulator [Metallococcus carri]NHN56977.1 LysR family transcriptional regulator [Metallococcus carri]NOP37722.1 LysR family transcriptional regulator [Calidifontibacter sp. DB2511S]
MDPRHLTLLRELAERGSVRAVAAATHRTPSAVSQQLRTAERELRCRLVEPDGRGVRLTDAGRLLAAEADGVETAIARAETRLAEFRGRPEGRVSIAVLPSAGELLIPGLLRALRDEPIEISLTDDDVAEVGYTTLARDHDIVIGHSLVSGRPEGAEGMVCTVLAREPIDLAVAAGHPLATRRWVRPRDLVAVGWIAVPEGYPFRSVLHEVEEVTGAPAEIRHVVRDNRLVEALVIAGEGVGLLPRFTTRPREGLVTLPIRGAQAQRWVVAISRPARAERLVVQRVVRELRRAARSALAAP